MINIIESKDCCGCNACVQKCPKKCIEMKQDKEGFLYPIVNKDLCIDCGLCDKVCPVINQYEERKPLNVFASKNRDEEIRLKSASGGIFSLLANQTIDKGGIVFGAIFNEGWQVEHISIDNHKDVYRLRGSKYLQSQINDSFKSVEKYLKEGKDVLFSGTPCQIAGLKHYLIKDYENLTTVDLVCHGIPSPMIWNDYLKYVIDKNKDFKKIPTSERNSLKISSVNFREKATGWKRYSIKITAENKESGQQYTLVNEPGYHNIFMMGFLKNLYIRPSCHFCPARKGKSGSDLTIADYWGINRFKPEFDDDKGVGLVMVNNEKGLKLFNSLETESIETSFEDALKGNKVIAIDSERCKYRDMFWAIYEQKGISAIVTILDKLKPGLLSRIISFGKRIIRKILG